MEDDDFGNLKESLFKMKLDYIDIFQLHAFDHRTDIIETFEEVITKIIPLIIKDDPLLASQVSSRATQSGVTMESLVNEFRNLIRLI